MRAKTQILLRVCQCVIEMTSTFTENNLFQCSFKNDPQAEPNLDHYLMLLLILGQKYLDRVELIRVISMDLYSWCLSHYQFHQIRLYFYLLIYLFLKALSIVNIIPVLPSLSIKFRIFWIPLKIVPNNTLGLPQFEVLTLQKLISQLYHQHKPKLHCNSTVRASILFSFHSSPMGSMTSNV